MHFTSKHMLDSWRLFEQVDYLRRDAGQTWTDVARELNVNRTTLVNLRNGSEVSSGLLLSIMMWMGKTDINDIVIERREE